MTPAARILADAREFEANTGVPSDEYLAAICAALARHVGNGYLRIGRTAEQGRSRKQAHPETLVEGETP